MTQVFRVSVGRGNLGRGFFSGFSEENFYERFCDGF